MKVFNELDLNNNELKNFIVADNSELPTKSGLLKFDGDSLFISKSSDGGFKWVPITGGSPTKSEKIKILTQSEYDKLGSYDDSTIYFIKEEE